MSDTTYSEEWFSAIRNNDIDKIDRLLEKGFDIETKTANGRTGIHIAAEYDTIKALEFLISKGANANAIDDGSESAIMLTALYGHTACFKLLLPLSAEPDLTLSLLLSSWSGYTKITELLLAANANFLIKDWNEKSALDWAKEQGNVNIIRLIEDKALNNTIKTNNSMIDLAF